MSFLDPIFNHQRIRPEQIAQPFQLLAAALVFVLLLDSAFLSAAAVLSDHLVLSFLLVVAAILNPPGLLGGLFVLQTRYRDELLGDQAFLRMKEISADLRRTVDKTGFDVTQILGSAPTAGLSSSDADEIQNRAKELERAIAGNFGNRAGDQLQIIAEAERDLAHADLARGRWKEGADRLSGYLAVNSDDYREWFAQGTAYANARGGSETDALSVLAYSRALEALPSDVEPQTKARLHTYMAGVLKRDPKKRLLAEQELERAQEYTEVGSYEADDIHYNQAAILAMRGETDLAMRELRTITDPWYFDAIHAHRDDYFLNLASRDDFQALMAKRPDRSA